ncbi:MAG: hypothetical protein BIFFINMI_01251 [Phycisphaerae bacterium]|nr:hypothetical protein [Phycisphaerae bacterium]
MPPHAKDESALVKMAEEIFNISLIGWQMRQQQRSTGGWDLSETEYLALDLLSRQGTMNVGQLQRQIGVLPAQMSRIVRALESKFDHPLIQCSINPHDKRKVDVSLSDTGRRAREEFRQGRLSQSVKVLSELEESDIEQFMSLMRKIRQTMAASVRPEE